MPIHKQLRDRRVAAWSKDVMSEDVLASVHLNAPQQQQQLPSEETSVVSYDYSDRGSRKPAYQIGTKVKKFIDGHGWVNGQVDSLHPTSYRVVYDNGLFDHYNDQEMDEIVKLAAVKVGTKLAVFWYEEDCYQRATVFKERNETKSVLVEYEDGAGREWIDLRRNKFYLLTTLTSSQNNNNNSSEGSETPGESEMGQASVDNKEGTNDGDCARDPLLGKVAAWSTQESDLSKAMSSADEHNVSARLRADDDDDNDVNSSDDEMDMLTKENPSDSLVKIGTRVSLWWPEDAHYYGGTITHVRRTNTKPFYIEYDDGKFEWIDLRLHKFHLLPSAQETSRRVADDCLPEAKNGTDTVEKCVPRPNVHDELKIKPTKAKDHAGSSVGVDPKELATVAEMNLDLEAKLEAESEPELVGSESGAELAGKLDSSSDRAGADIEKALDHDKAENNARSESESDNDDGTRIAAQSDDGARIAAQSDAEILEDSEEEESIKEENPDIALVDVGSRVGIWWPEDRRYYKGVIVDRRKGRKPLQLEYDDDDEKEWIDLREHRFRILRETARRFTAQTFAKTVSMKDEREDVVVRKRGRRVASKSRADTDNTDNGNGETGHVAPLPKRWKSQILNSRRAASKPSSDTDNMDNETNADVATFKKRRRVELLKSSADTDNADDERVERNRDSSLVPKRHKAQPRNSRRAASKPSSEASPGASLVAMPSRAQLRDSGRFASTSSPGMSPGVRRRRKVVFKSSEDTGNTDDEPGDVSLDNDNVDEERVEASPDVSLVSVGLRVAVWWPEDQKYYNGTVTKKRIGEMPFYLEYDDGEEEWINFLNHRFRLLRDGTRRNKILVEVESEMECSDIDVKAVEASPDVSAVTVGSRVAVWWPAERRHYKGIVTKERQGKDPFFLEYDDGEKEWINFRDHSFRLQTETKLQRVERRKKRLAFMSELSNSPTGRKSSKDLQVEVGSRVAVFWPDDRMYYEGTVTRQRDKKNPFYLEYDDGEKEWIDFREHRVRLSDKPPVNMKHRLFGEERPSKQRRIDSSGLQTPSSVLLCDTPDIAKIEVGTRLSVWWSGDEEFFDGTVTRIRITDRSKKPFHVEYDDGDSEWIDLAQHTFRLLGQSGGYPKTTNDNKNAASEESRKSAKMSRSRTADFDESDRNEESSNAELENLDDGRLTQKDGIAVEQVDLETNEVIAVFHSARQASARTGISPCSIRRVLDRKGEANAGGFFWRFASSDQAQKRVEKICPETGKLRHTYVSVYEAARDLGVSAARIRSVVDGRSLTCQGFFWRFRGSDKLPPKRRVQRAVNQLCLKTGRVLATYQSIAEAAKIVGITSPGISYCCNGRNGHSSAAGFRWKFS